LLNNTNTMTFKTGYRGDVDVLLGKCFPIRGRRNREGDPLPRGRRALAEGAYRTQVFRRYAARGNRSHERERGGRVSDEAGRNSPNACLAPGAARETPDILERSVRNATVQNANQVRSWSWITKTPRRGFP